MTKARMITSMGGADFDLPFGTELSVGERYAPKEGSIDSATAERWLEAGILEILDGEPKSDTAAVTLDDEPVLAVVRRSTRRKA